MPLNQAIKRTAMNDNETHYLTMATGMPIAITSHILAANY